MACRRNGKFSSGGVAAGATCPAVVVRGAAGGHDTCSAELLTEVGDGNMKLPRSCREMRSWEWVAVQSAVSVLLVAVRAATKDQSLAVAVARFAMASNVSFW